MKKASFLFISTICAAAMVQAKMMEFKGRSNVPDKNGNSICRLEVHQNDQGQTEYIIVRGYFVSEYIPGIMTKAIGSKADTSIRWTNRSASLVDDEGKALEQSSCTFNKVCLQVKSSENSLEIRQKQAGPVEDTYEYLDTSVKVTGQLGAPSKVEISQKSVIWFMVFKDTGIDTLTCDNLKAVN